MTVLRRFQTRSNFSIVRDSLRILRLCASLVSAGVLFGNSFAVELPVIRLDTVFPPGGKAGTEVEVGITGADLDEASALHFSHPGITASPKAKGFIVKIAPEVPPGIYDVRVSGTLGVSNPRAFVVGDSPELIKTKPNDKQEAAVELPFGSVFNGNAAAAAADYFKFTAKKGQRLLIECASEEIDSRLSPVLDVEGYQPALSRRGGLLDFTAPADGPYLLGLHDLVFGGGPAHFYRLRITTGPRIDFVFPPSGLPGTKGKFTLYGRNLPASMSANLAGIDGKPLEKLDVEIALPAAAEGRASGVRGLASVALDGFSYRLETPQGAANPVFIGFASAPVAIEQEPNNKPGQAQKLTVPCEVAAQFYPANDTDCFTFDAKKGDVYWLEIFSNRLGLPTNPFLLVKRDTADVQEIYGSPPSPDGKYFSAPTNDSAARFEAKEDGLYRIEVRDLFGNTRSDPRNIYRLAIRREAPDFRLIAVVEPVPAKKDDRTAAPQAPLLRGGGTIAIKVLALRRDNFAGDIELSAEGLPAGVACVSTRILSGKNDGLLLLTACEKPAAWVGPIRILGKAKIGGADLVREARGGTVRWSVADFSAEQVGTRLTGDFMLAVSGSETAPISLEPAEDKAWEAPAGGKLAIPLKVTRRGEFKEALKIKGAGAPAIETWKEIDIDAKSALATATLDLAAVKIPAGAHTIYFEAQTKGKFRGKDVTTAVYSTPIRIVVKAPEAK